MDKLAKAKEQFIEKLNGLPSFSCIMTTGEDGIQHILSWEINEEQSKSTGHYRLFYIQNIHTLKTIRKPLLTCPMEIRIHMMPFIEKFMDKYTDYLLKKVGL